jgi:hypothetical protein
MRTPHGSIVVVYRRDADGWHMRLVEPSVPDANTAARAALHVQSCAAIMILCRLDRQLVRLYRGGHRLSRPRNLFKNK